MKFGVRSWINLVTLLVALFGVLAASPLLAQYAPYILLVVALLNVTLTWLQASFPENASVKFMAG